MLLAGSLEVEFLRFQATAGIAMGALQHKL
jgi:hypothetical protein